MGPLTLDHAAADSASGLPSPTLTNPEMILPCSRPETPSTRSPSPQLMYPHDLQAAFARAPVRHDSKQAKQKANVSQLSSSSPLSRSPGESVAVSSVNSDDLESITWSRFDDGTETGSDMEDDEDEERFGSFPEVARSDKSEQWDVSQSDLPEEDEFSSTALSRRADMILANAKKRLSLMEGNLRGARSSLVSPTGTFSALRSPLLSQERHIASSLGFSSQKQYQASQYPPSAHSRMLSSPDVADPILLPSFRKELLRASSAMAFTLSAAPGDRGFALRESRSQEQMLLKRWNSVNEGTFLLSTPESRSSSDLDAVPEHCPLSSSAHRSPSTTTDLREQMNDLKGRISKLQQRAREDGIKRRSLQSSQTPSPFTSAPEVWYSEDESEDTDSATVDNANTSMKWAAESVAEQSKDAVPMAHADETVDVESHYEDAEEEPEAATSIPPGSGSSDDEVIIPGCGTTDAESVYEDAYATMNQPERHEDRADAFDYERFFLHSAMGTITNTSRRSSVSSHDSVETTRPASPSQNTTVEPGLHKRMPSVESISTEASFVTATTGLDSENDGDPMNRIESALGTTWPATSFLNNSPTLGTADSARNSQVSIQPRLDNLSPSADLLSVMGATRLDDADKALVGALEHSLRLVCEQLDVVRHSSYDRREWRRRLDAARKALQGELY